MTLIETESFSNTSQEVYNHFNGEFVGIRHCTPLRDRKCDLLGTVLGFGLGFAICGGKLFCVENQNSSKFIPIRSIEKNHNRPCNLNSVKGP